MAIPQRLKKALLLMLLSSVFMHAKAQSVIVGTNFVRFLDTYGPFRVNSTTDTAYSRYAYIYNAQSIDGLEHGDSITALSFFRTGSDWLRNGPNVKIFVRMSILSDFGTGPLNWASESKSTGMVKVFDGDPTAIVGRSGGWKQFPFDKPYYVDTTLGKEHLEVLVEYTQTQRESLIPWVYESNFTVPTFISSNESKYQSGSGLPQDTVRGSNIRKPYLKIHVPRHDTNMRVNKIFSLGRAPLLMGGADTIKAWVENEGRNTVYNKPVYLKVSGSNKHLDTLIIDSLRPFEERLIEFGNHTEMNKSGVEFLNVHFDADGDPEGDSLIIRRDVNYNVYSQANPYETFGGGGIGFNGLTGDFVAKFYVDTVQFMNQIKVDFARLNSVYMLGIWEADANGRPGKEIYMSDTLYSTLGTNILRVSPKVKIDGAFFVGIRQATNTNVGFSYQDEVPLRPGIFYYTVPAGGTNWVEFDTYNEAFKFNIQPRIQVANDVSVLAIRNPNVSDTIEYSKDSIAPMATIINYGYANQNAPFDVVCEVENEYGQIIYKSTKTVTIKAEDTLQITFDKELNFIYVRNNTIRVYTKLPNDRVTDNDTFTANYYVGILHDVFVEGFFSPFDNDEFKLNTDYVKPVARLVNNGIRDKNNIDVTLEALSGGKIFYTQDKMVSIQKEGSLILPFDSFVLSEEGIVEIRVYTHGVVDSFPINDTARVYVNVVKNDDIGLLSIIRPKDQEIYHRKTRFQPFVNVRNEGTEDQDSVSIVCTIRDANGNEIFKDTATKKYTRISTTQEIFDEFIVPDSNMTLYVEFVVYNKGDQEPKNDTLRSTIYTKLKLDLGVVSVNAPTANEEISYKSGDYIPKVQLKNFGTDPVSANQWVWVRVTSGGSQTYFDSAQVTFALPADTSFEVAMPNGFGTEVLGNYNLTAWVGVSGDQEQRNDTVKTAYSVTANHSLELLQVIVPTADQRFQQNKDIIEPKVTIRNSGLQDVSTEIVIHYLATHNKAIANSQSLKLDELKSGRDTTLELTPYPAGIKGDYVWEVALVNSQDQIDTDDSLDGKYFVDKKNDIKAYQLLFPTNDTVMDANTPYVLSASFINLGDSDQVNPFSVTMQVFESSTMIYNSNASITIDAGDTLKVDFPAAFTPTQKADFTYLVFSRLFDDQEVTNDTIDGNFSAKWSASIGKLDERLIHIYPNPSSGKVSLELASQYSGSMLRIYDSRGVLMKTVEKVPEYQELNLNNWTSGIYFFELSNTSGISRNRIILTH